MRRYIWTPKNIALKHRVDWFPCKPLMRIQGVPYPLKPPWTYFSNWLTWRWKFGSSRIRKTNILQWKKTTMNEDAYGKWIKWTSPLLNNHTSRRFTSSFLVVFPWWSISFPTNPEPFRATPQDVEGDFRHHCLYFNVLPVMWWILVVLVNFGTFRIWTRTIQAMKLRSRLCIYHVVYLHTKLHI